MYVAEYRKRSPNKLPPNMNLGYKVFPFEFEFEVKKPKVR